MKSVALTLATMIALVGCSPASTTNAEQPNAQTDVAAALANEAPLESSPPPPAPPPHRYQFKEGATYGYITAVSEEDAKKGQAAGHVVMYTYRGNDGGVYRLDMVDADGSLLGKYECSKPCVAIKGYERSSIVRIPYASESVIGAAFDDAMNGYLERLSAPRRSGWAGTYKGTFEGNASGTVSIKGRGSQLAVSIGVGSPTCSGSLEFTVDRPAGNVLTKSLEPDDSGNACTMKLTRDGDVISLKEDSCLFYHGAECSFAGSATR